MANGCHHLTRDERCQIYALRKRGVSFRGIARDPECSPSTISREIRRNSGRRGYQLKQADQLACKRRHLASCLPRKMSAALWHGIEERLAQQQWSPEQNAGRRSSASGWHCFREPELDLSSRVERPVGWRHAVATPPAAWQESKPAWSRRCRTRGDTGPGWYRRTAGVG